MARRKARPTPETAQAAHQRESFLGALRGRSDVPIPVGRDANSLARARAGGSSANAVQAYQDVFTLSGGAETVELTYLPLTYSEHTYLNGVYQREGDDYDWTRESGTRTVNVDADMDARAGDILIVEYLYYAGTPAAPTALPSIPDAPAFWYKFNETSGTSLANSGSENGTTATVGASGVLGQDALSPDGGAAIGSVAGGVIADYTTWTGSQILSQGCWFKGTLAAGGTFRVRPSSSPATWRDWFGHDQTYVDFGGVATNVLSSEVLDGDTHLVVTTYSGTTLSFYLDGVLRDTVPGQRPHMQGATNGHQMYGNTIDDFAGWDRALTATEIQTWWGQ